MGENGGEWESAKVFGVSLKEKDIFSYEVTRNTITMKVYYIGYLYDTISVIYNIGYF